MLSARDIRQEMIYEREREEEEKKESERESREIKHPKLKSIEAHLDEMRIQTLPIVFRRKSDKGKWRYSLSILICVVVLID